MSAAKDTKNKVDLSIIPLASLIPLAQALVFGSEKYARYNFYKGHLNTDLIAAALRHLHKYNEGEDIDAESGVNHLGLAMANCAMILQQVNLGTVIEGRFLPATKPDKEELKGVFWERDGCSIRSICGGGCS